MHQYFNVILNQEHVKKRKETNLITTFCNFFSYNFFFKHQPILQAPDIFFILLKIPFPAQLSLITKQLNIYFTITNGYH